MCTDVKDSNRYLTFLCFTKWFDIKADSGLLNSEHSYVWLDKLSEVGLFAAVVPKVPDNDPSECDFNISIFDIIGELSAMSRSADSRSEVQHPVWSQIRWVQAVCFDVSLQSSPTGFHITGSDPSHQNHHTVWLLKAPQFYSSMHAVLIIHKASNYTSIKPANTKLGISKGCHMDQVHYGKHPQPLWVKTHSEIMVDWRAIKSQQQCGSSIPEDKTGATKTR